ncbi:hypothetical protein CLD22_21090 [Rubrivivax gelatinosus]|nr:hypothetical protein [Rubrivivax gelatinosus]
MPADGSSATQARAAHDEPTLQPKVAGDDRTTAPAETARRLLALCARLTATASSSDGNRNGLLAPPGPGRPGLRDTAHEHVRSRLHDGLFALARQQSQALPCSPPDTITDTDTDTVASSSSSSSPDTGTDTGTGTGAGAGTDAGLDLCSYPDSTTESITASASDHARTVSPARCASAAHRARQELRRLWTPAARGRQRRR